MKVYGPSGTPADVIPTNGHNGLVAIAPGHVSTINSSNTLLAGDAVFTGEWEDITNFGVIVVSLASDVGSAVDGLMVEFSTEGSVVTRVAADEYTIAAGAEKTFSFQTAAKFYRLVYTNGSSVRASFNLQVVLKPYYVKPSSHRIQDAIIDDDDAELVKAVLTGVDPNSIYRNINATADGDLTISDNSSGLSIAEGNVTGKTFVHKFGEAPDFDQADGEVTMWDGANDALFAGSPPMTYTFSSSADIGLISSSDNGDTQEIEIQGLDTDFNLVIQTITLTGQTDVDMSAVGGTDLIRVFRMKNIGSTDIAGVVYIRTNGSAQTNGVPNTVNTVRAIINNGNNQTLMAVYTVPNGKTGYMRSWFAATAGANRSSEYKIKIKARPEGQVFKVKHSSAISDEGTSKDNHPYIEPEVFAAKTDIIMAVTMLLSAATQADISGGFDIVLVDD